MPLHMTWTVTGTVDDLYRPGAITAAADDSLEQIADRLQDKDISALVILDGYRLAGIITERDIVRAVADRRDLADGTAGEYMTSAPATVALETPLAEVARRMLAYGVRHLPRRPDAGAAAAPGIVLQRKPFRWPTQPSSSSVQIDLIVQVEVPRGLWCRLMWNPVLPTGPHPRTAWSWTALSRLPMPGDGPGPSAARSPSAA